MKKAIAVVFSKVEVSILRWLIIPLLGSWLSFHGFWKEDKKLVVHAALKFCIGFCSCHILSGCLQFSLNGINNYFTYSSIFMVSFKLQMSKCEVRLQGMAIPKTRGPKKRLQLSRPVPHLGNVPCPWGKTNQQRVLIAGSTKLLPASFFPDCPFAWLMRVWWCLNTSWWCPDTLWPPMLCMFWAWRVFNIAPKRA
jgi:hypothetical protein